MNFKNQIVGLQVVFVLNTHVKFRSNWGLFTIRSIKLFFIHHFLALKIVIRKYNPMIRFSKFTSN